MSATSLEGIGLPERYVVRGHIASGGMGSVWCAEDTALGREVAIKVLAGEFAGDERAIRRFKREARTAARLSAHPHVVMIYDVGEAAGPVYRDGVSRGRDGGRRDPSWCCAPRGGAQMAGRGGLGA